MSYLVRFILCALIAASSVTTALECRRTSSILNSAASLGNNAAAGGHVWIHVLGLQRPLAWQPHQTAGRTMFASEQDFLTAWNTFTNRYMIQRRFAYCNWYPTGDCIPARDLGITTAYTCRRINHQTGLCDYASATPLQSRNLMIAFWYIWKRGQWILNTAYPTTLPRCR